MVNVLDKQFVPYINEEQLNARIDEMAKEISEHYNKKDPLFLGILNGAFVFASDLYKKIPIPSTITFIKLASYKGTASTGNVITAIGLEENIKDRNIIILEDIVDTGKTLSAFLPTIQNMQPASIEICALLQKPDALQHPLNVKYVGFNIPNRFVVGYGLDYDGYGRNFPMIYQLA